MSETKKCHKCGVERHLDCFYKNKSQKDGLQGKCIACDKIRTKLYRKTPEGKATQARYYRKASTPGVYILTIGDQFYIGETNNLAYRERSHKSRLRNGTHESKTVQAAYDTYGSCEFKTILITSEPEYYEALLLEEHIDGPNCLNTRMPKETK